MANKTIKAAINPEGAALGYVQAARTSLETAQRVLPRQGCEHIADGLVAVLQMIGELEMDFYK